MRTSSNASKSADFSKRLFQIFLILFIGCISSCKKHVEEPHPLSGEDSLHVIQEIFAHRAEVDSVFRFDPESPFNQDTSVLYEGLKWFGPDIKYYFRVMLHRYEKPETVTVFGTKGDERRQLKYGYFEIPIEGTLYHLNVYKFTSSDSPRFAAYQNYLSVWFTDETTGKETYEVGRYVDVGEEVLDTSHLYTVNFNHAYNPYCAYSGLYSCAVPRKEDHFDCSLRAGELKYHE